MKLETLADGLIRSHGELHTLVDVQAHIILRQAHNITALSTETLELKDDIAELTLFCDYTEEVIGKDRKENAELRREVGTQQQKVEDLQQKLEMQGKHIEHLMVSFIDSTTDARLVLIVFLV